MCFFVGTVLDDSYVSTVATSLQYLRETITSNLRISQNAHLKRKFISLAGEMLRTNTGSLVCDNKVFFFLSLSTRFFLLG